MTLALPFAAATTTYGVTREITTVEDGKTVVINSNSLGPIFVDPINVDKRADPFGGLVATGGGALKYECPPQNGGKCSLSNEFVSALPNR